MVIHHFILSYLPKKIVTLGKMDVLLAWLQSSLRGAYPNVSALAAINIGNSRTK